MRYSLDFDLKIRSGQVWLGFRVTPSSWEDVYLDKNYDCFENNFLKKAILIKSGYLSSIGEIHIDAFYETPTLKYI